MRPSSSAYNIPAQAGTNITAENNSRGAVSRMIQRFLSRRLSMSIEISSIGQHVTTMDRRLEGTGNTSTRSASSAVQPSRQDNPVVSTQLSEADVARIAEQIQKISDMFDRKLQFQVSKELEQVIVKVIDSSTDKIIREIPSAEIQKLQLRIKETLGLLFDESI